MPDMAVKLLTAFLSTQRREKSLW